MSSSSEIVQLEMKLQINIELFLNDCYLGKISQLFECVYLMNQFNNVKIIPLLIVINASVENNRHASVLRYYVKLSIKIV